MAANLYEKEDTTSGKASSPYEERTIEITSFSGKSTTFYCCHNFTSKTIWVIDGKNYSSDELPSGYNYVKDNYPGIKLELKYTKNNNSTIKCRSKDIFELFNLSESKCELINVTV